MDTIQSYGEGGKAVCNVMCLRLILATLGQYRGAIMSPLFSPASVNHCNLAMDQASRKDKTMATYLAEYTDTFGGEANYSWVRHAAFEHAEADKPGRAGSHAMLRKARALLGLTGVKGDITADFDDEVHWVPRGCCTILMVRWDDSPEILRMIADAKVDHEAIRRIIDSRLADNPVL